MKNRTEKAKKEEEAAEKLRCLEAEMAIDGEELDRVTEDPLAVEECLASWGVSSPLLWFDPTTGVSVENMPIAGSSLS